MSNPIASLTKKEWWVWIGSLLGMTMPMAIWSTITWILASMKNPRYLSVTVIFIIFFFYDVYGFISWKKREQRVKSR